MKNFSDIIPLNGLLAAPDWAPTLGFFCDIRAADQALFRLRSRHNLLRKFSHRWLNEGTQCRFGCLDKEETSEHFMLECQKFEIYRSHLRIYFAKKTLPLTLNSILGLNPKLNKNTQFEISQLFKSLYPSIKSLIRTGKFKILWYLLHPSYFLLLEKKKDRLIKKIILRIWYTQKVSSIRGY